MSDEVLVTLGATVEAHTQPGADPRQWLDLSADKQFSLQGFDDGKLFLGRMSGMEKRPDAWHDEVVRWDRSLPWDASSLTAKPTAIECLGCYLHLLNTRPGEKALPFEGVVELAQRRLSSLLLEHPVLMHPRLRVYVNSGFGRGLVSAAHAVAMTRMAAFPMDSDGAALEQLRLFANHPCTKLGLCTPSLPIIGDLPAARTRNALSTAFTLLSPHPHLLASVAGLDALLGPEDDVGKGPPGPYLSNWTSTTRKNESAQHVSVLVSSLLNSCGGWTLGTEGFARQRACPEYQELLRQTGWATTDDFLDTWMSLLHSGLIPGSRQAGSSRLMADPGLSYEQVSENVELILQGTVASGIADDLGGAAWEVRDLLSDRPPSCNAEHALAVIRALDAHGSRMEVSDLRECESSAVWAQALGIQRGEESMQGIIDSEKDRAELGEETATPRRPRRTL